ncbi:putative protein [Geobacter sp. OR-1]|uniref:class I SAM-dependent methyltransferase n=1 Tax=Geobacter sp. OR-1 TaxID=1266765 RepID=UPI0005441FEB|nr:class I SAM-dependent methyltransferase [Geobacter sp. OR-1]GAM11083.1 putative protein [Geobacter sp. OR-1]
MRGGLLQTISRGIRQLARGVGHVFRPDREADNARVRRENPAVRFPPCSLSTAALNHCDNRQYLDSGLAHARFIMQTIRGYSSDQNLVICEWGCGPGRIIQHLQSLDNGIARLIGTDCHEASMDWCRENLPAIEFQTNGMAPPLLLATGSIDVVYCCAVFSHLGEPLHHAWISEILRLLRPGGLLIATVNGNNLEDRMSGDELAAYRNGSLIVRPEGREGETGFVSFAGDRFIRDSLFNRFENITRLDDTPFLQTVWTATAPAT